MKRLIFVCAAAAWLAACASKPTPADFAAADAATKPANDEGAHKAVVDYFARKLKDPESARYTFLPPTKGVLSATKSHEAGWFICGTVNAKNSYGGYVGAQTFLAYFDPTSGTRVVDGAIDDSEYSIVEGWCEGLYSH